MLANLQPKPEEKERKAPPRAATAETGATSGVPLFLTGSPASRRGASDAEIGDEGRPLDEPTRRYFEPRFGRDLSDVRVHTGAKAAEKARAVGAVAFTVGSNIAFDERQYDPAGRRGRNLLAHELAHVVQQSRGVGMAHGAPADRQSAEAQADRAARHSIEHGYAGALTAVAPRLQRQPAPSLATIVDSRLEIGISFRGAPLGIGINLDDEVRPYFDGDPELKDRLRTYLDGVFNPPGGPLPETARFLSGARVEGLIEKDLPTWIFAGSMPTLVGLLQARADELRKQQVRAKLEERLGVNPGTVDWAAQIPQLRSEFIEFVDMSTVGGAAMYDRAEMFLNILENEIVGAAPVVGGVVPPALADTVFEYAVDEVKYDHSVRLLFAEKFIEVNLDATARLRFVPEGFDLARFAPKGTDIAEGRRNDLIDQFIEFQAERLTTKFLLDEWVTTGADPQLMLANLDVDKEKDKIFDFLADEFMKQAKADPQMASAIRETASDQARFDLLTTVVLVGRSNEVFNQGLPALLGKDENALDDQQRAIVHDPDTYYQTSLNLAEATRTILNDVSAGANVAQSTIQHASEIAGRAEIPKSFGVIATLLAMGMAIGELHKAVTEQTLAARMRISERLKISWKEIADVINNRGKEADKFIDETFKPLLKKIARERIQKNYDELKNWQDNFFPETSRVIDRYRLAASILDEVADKLDSGEEQSATLNGESVEKKDVPKIRTASAYMNAKADKLGSAWGKFEKWQELKKAVDAFADVMAGIDSEKYKPNHFGPSVFEEARRQLGIGGFESGTTVGDVVLRRKSVRDNPFEAWAVERWTYFELVYEQQDQLTTFAIIGVLAIATFLLPGISAAFLAALDVGAGVAGAVEAGVAVAATGADVGFNLHEGWKGVKSAQAMLDLARVDTDLSIQGVTVEQAEEALHDAWVGMVITAVLGGLALGIAGAGLFKAVRSMRFPHLAKLAESDPGLAAKLLKSCGDSKLTNTLLGHFAGDGLKLAEALEFSKDAKSLNAIIGQVKDANMARRLLQYAEGEEKLAPLLKRFKNYKKLEELLISASPEELVTLFDLTKSETSVVKLLETMPPGRAQLLLESGLNPEQSIVLHAIGPGAETQYFRLIAVGGADARDAVAQILSLSQRGTYDARVIESALQRSTEFLESGIGGETNVVQRYAKLADAEKKLEEARKEVRTLEEARRPADAAKARANQASKNLATELQAAPGARSVVNQSLDEILRGGAALNPPTAQEVTDAINVVKSPTATQAQLNDALVVLVRKSAEDAKAYLNVRKGSPLTFDVVKDCCGPGRDISAASFGSLAADSPVPIGLDRFQASGVFKGVKDPTLLRRHAFTVVRFPNGESYLIDPTFAQFLHPTEIPVSSISRPEQFTAQTIRATPKGATFARDLARDGFIPLTEENARLYARAMGVSENELEEMAARLMKGDQAAIREDIGGGFASNPNPVGNLPNQTPEEILERLRDDVIPALEQSGDPQGLLPMTRDLERRMDEVVQRGPTTPRQITESHD